MRVLLGFILGLCFSGGMVWYNSTLHEVKVPPTPPSPEQVAQKKKDDWTQANNRNGSGIRLWVDTKRDVVCYVLNDSIGSALISGISCLPRSQVTNLPY